MLSIAGIHNIHSFSWTTDHPDDGCIVIDCISKMEIAFVSVAGCAITNCNGCCICGCDNVEQAAGELQLYVYCEQQPSSINKEWLKCHWVCHGCLHSVIANIPS